MKPKCSLACSQNLPSTRHCVTVNTVVFLYRYSVVILPPSSKLKECDFLPFLATYSAYSNYSTYLQTGSSAIPNLRECLPIVTKDPLSMEVYAASLGVSWNPVCVPRFGDYTDIIIFTPSTESLMTVRNDRFHLHWSQFHLKQDINYWN
jgi:hypothetical protein